MSKVTKYIVLFLIHHHLPEAKRFRKHTPARCKMFNDQFANTNQPYRKIHDVLYCVCVETITFFHNKKHDFQIKMLVKLNVGLVH